MARRDYGRDRHALDMSDPLILLRTCWPQAPPAAGQERGTSVGRHVTEFHRQAKVNGSALLDRHVDLWAPAELELSRQDVGIESQ